MSASAAAAAAASVAADTTDSVALDSESQDFEAAAETVRETLIRIAGEDKDDPCDYIACLHPPRESPYTATIIDPRIITARSTAEAFVTMFDAIKREFGSDPYMDMVRNYMDDEDGSGEVYCDNQCVHDAAMDVIHYQELCDDNYGLGTHTMHHLVKLPAVTRQLRSSLSPLVKAASVTVTE